MKKGQPLIRLGDESDTNYAAAQLELVSAQKALNDLQNTSGTDLAQAVIDLKEAKEDYDDADDYLRLPQEFQESTPNRNPQRSWSRPGRGMSIATRPRHFKGPAPEDWIIEAENDLALKKAELEAAQRTYDRMKDGIDAEQLAVLEARLECSQSRCGRLLEVIAPFDGVVAELNAKTGSSINAGETAVTVADFSSWLVKTTDLTEIDVVELGREISRSS